MDGALPYTLANHYDFEGDGLSGVLDCSSVNGSPIASLRVAEISMDSVEVTSHAFGWWLEATLEVIHDSHSKVVSVVIPRVNTSDGEAAFDAFGVIVTHRTNMGGEPMVNGPLELYDVRALRGAASNVQSFI